MKINPTASGFTVTAKLPVVTVIPNYIPDDDDGTGEAPMVFYSPTKTVYTFDRASGTWAAGGGALPAQAAHTVLANVTAGSAVPTASTTADLIAGGIIQDPTAVAITGGNITGVNAATHTVQGSMSAADKTKLDAIVTGADISTTLGAANATITVTGLDGDRDGDYLIHFHLVSNNAGAQTVTFKFNSSASNMESTWFQGTIGGSHTADWTPSNTVAYAFVNGTTAEVIGRLSCRTGRVRVLEVKIYVNDTTHSVFYGMGICTETSTNLTTFQVVASVASGLASGSFAAFTPLGTTT